MCRWLAAVLAAVCLLTLPSQLDAHGVLRRSDPANGAQLSVVPRELRLTFSERVEPALARLGLTGPSGPVSLGQAGLSPDSATILIARVVGAMGAGRYTVSWQVVGRDGHPVRGEYSFAVLPGAEGVAEVTSAPAEPQPPTQPSPPPESARQVEFGAGAPLYVLVRWLGFVGLLGTVGVVAFRLLVLPRAGSGGVAALQLSVSRSAAWLGIAMAVFVLLAAVIRLYAQALTLAGDTLNGELIRTILVGTLWGSGWFIQMAGAIVALFGFLLARNHRAVGWGLAAVGALALCFASGLLGHAAAAPRLSLLAVLADGLHVLGAGGWLGSLLLVLLIGIPAALRLEPSVRGGAVASLVNAFSPVALIFAGMVVVTGVFAAWIHLGSVAALWQSAYGRTLLLKLGVLSLLFATGAYNWLRVRPALGDEAGTRRLRRSTTWEIGVGALVLAVTAVLVATPPP